MPLPINDTIIAAIAQLIDDSKSGEYREPSHSDLDFYVQRAGLAMADPKAQGQVVGKAKRIRATLSWALEYDLDAGSKLVEAILSKVRACGGFRDGSSNHVGAEAISNAVLAFDAEGYVLTRDGSIQPKVLSNLKGQELTAALAAYARRAQAGSEDAALLFGTGKDLLEATAAHVLMARTGTYPNHANFQGLLGQAYISLGLAVPEIQAHTGEPPMAALERALFQAACSVNRLRNREGTGHGRPWVSSVGATDARTAVETVGVVAGFLLGKLEGGA